MYRNLSLDILRIIMAFMVVAIHTRFLSDISPVVSHLLIKTLFNIAVPVFLLINGFYFYPVLQKDQLRGWTKKIVYLYIFWMLVYSIYWFPFSDFSVITLLKAIKTILFGYAQLWYIPAMFGAALMIMLFKNLSSKVLLLLIIVLYCTGVILQYSANYHAAPQPADKILNYYWFHRNFLFIGFAFFGIGFLIHKHNIHENITTLNLFKLFLTGILILYIEVHMNYTLYINNGDLSNQLFLLILAPVLFLFVMRLNFKTQNRLLTSLAASIYFVHMLIIYILQKTTDLPATALTLTVFFLSALLSVFIIQLNKKVKFIL